MGRHVGHQNVHLGNFRKNNIGSSSGLKSASIAIIKGLFCDCRTAWGVGDVASVRASASIRFSSVKSVFGARNPESKEFISLPGEIKFPGQENEMRPFFASSVGWVRGKAMRVSWPLPHAAAPTPSLPVACKNMPQNPPPRYLSFCSHLPRIGLRRAVWPHIPLRNR